MCYEGKHVTLFDKDDAIRHENCSIFVQSHQLRCATCSEYCQTLNRMSCRAQNQVDNNRISSSNPKSHTNYRYLQSSQKDERLTQLHNQARVDQQKIEAQDAYTEIGRGEKCSYWWRYWWGVEGHNSWKDITNQQHLPWGLICQTFLAKSRKMHVTERQEVNYNIYIALHNFTLHSSMKWDPLMIRWCLYLRHVSGHGYDMLWESGSRLYLFHKSNCGVLIRNRSAVDGGSQNTVLHREREKCIAIWMRCTSKRELFMKRIVVGIMISKIISAYTITIYAISLASII